MLDTEKVNNRFEKLKQYANQEYIKDDIKTMINKYRIFELKANFAFDVS